MALTLTLEHRRGLAPRESRTLTAGTLSIGRAAGNDWVLADPDRHLSKTHCVISIEGGRPVLTDLSTNGVFINGAREPTQRDSRVILTDGDLIRLGDHIVGVTELADAAGGDLDPFGFAPSAAPAVPPSAPAQAARGNPLLRGTPDPLGDDPLDNPFGHSPGQSGPQLGGQPAGQSAPPPSPFAHPRPAATSAAHSADPFDLLDESQKRPGVLDDDLFHGVTPADQWQGPSQPDNVDAPGHAFRAPKPITPAGLDEWDFDDLLGDTPPGQPTPPPIVPATTPPNTSLHDPVLHAPAAQASPAQGTAAPPPPAATAGSPDAAALLATFLTGAGVPDLQLGNQHPEAAMQAAGTLFRAMVDGLREVLMSRTAIKNEFRMEQTMLRAGDNNALKFSVTPEEAVAALLLPDRPGYKPPLDAVREAFDDVRGHEIAVMAGVQTALIGLLRRFDPAALETRLQPGMLDGVLPVARHARTWALFCATYKEIAREAEDDFQSVFGREFARAYDAQSRKL